MADQSNGEATPQTRITEELLKDSVKKASGAEEVDIIAFTSKSAIPKGHNFTSAILAVDVEAKVGGSQIKTFHFIIKEAPFDNSWLKLQKESEVFVKEIKVYTEMLPALVDVQRQYGVKDPVMVEAPGFYSSLKHPTCLVFENLSHEGYRIGDKREGLDYNHCRLVIKEVAKLHSLSYALKTRASKPLRTFPYLEDVFEESKETRHMYQAIMENSYDTAINAMEIFDPSLATKMKSIAGKANETMDKIVKDNEGFEMISHSDLWLHNMMFKYQKQGDVEIPVAVKLLDFQVTRVLNPSVDLNQFIYTSATVETRRNNHLQDLLKFYHDTFVGTLGSMGLEYPEFTFEYLQKKFHKDSLFGLIYGCVTLPLFMSAPEDAVGREGMADVGEEFAKRISEAATKLQNNKLYQSRLTSLVEEIHEIGLI